jgi:FkbM family methyltransferase
LYRIIPNYIQHQIASLEFTKKIRNSLLRDNSGNPKEKTVNIVKEHDGNKVNFKYRGPIKHALKAQKKGIESAALKSSIQSFREINEKDDAVIIDAGANYGFLSITWSLTISSNGGTVYGFEPMRCIVNTFRENLKLNRIDNIEVIQNALGRKNQILNFPINPIQSSFEKVEQVTLDHYFKNKNLSKCDIIKVDIDGDDYGVLLGAEQIIDQHRPIIIIETAGNNNIVSFLRDKNFVIKTLQLELIGEHDTLPKNIICLPK